MAGKRVTVPKQVSILARGEVAGLSDAGELAELLVDEHSLKVLYKICIDLTVCGTAAWRITAEGLPEHISLMEVLNGDTQQSPK